MARRLAVSEAGLFFQRERRRFVGCDDAFRLRSLRTLRSLSMWQGTAELQRPAQPQPQPSHQHPTPSIAHGHIELLHASVQPQKAPAPALGFNEDVSCSAVLCSSAPLRFWFALAG